ncbi:hypothetical protein L6452_06478 [Arctium lappa]|uniref:Uncharacterized protein n=1 Tax=Arctium lappa TaxID=4217 RepID=A0ACB9EJJ4_ARCLA|nr:hypothetical protein L6452_06478 [Arctium lappa]
MSTKERWTLRISRTRTSEEVRGDNISLSGDVISDKYGGDECMRKERNDVIVDPDEGGKTVVEDGRNDEEERDVSVGESSDDFRVGNTEADVSGSLTAITLFRCGFDLYYTETSCKSTSVGAVSVSVQLC